MDSFAVFVTLTSVLLGIAYPIITQITSNDKYSSEHILNLFEKDWRHKIFVPNLCFSLIFIGIYLLKLPPIFIFENQTANFLIENSAIIVLSISTTTLIISFFMIVSLIKIFYRTSALINFLTNQHKNVIDKNDFSSFEGLADLLYWAIQQQDENAARPLADYFYRIFQVYREKYETDEGVIYPNNFYWLVYRATEKIVGIEKNTLIFLENRTVGGIWLLGEFKTPKISDNTYSWLWTNIAFALNNNRGDLVMTFWRTTHQYFSFNLNYIQPEYNYEDGLIYKNQEAIDNRNMERETFLEFHYALGGLLLYKERTDLIKKIFYYTTSTPPNYVLLPKHMTQVFNMFFKFFDPFERHFPWITHKYNFPGLEGLNADRTIKGWVCKYISILFIRQLNLQSNFINWNPTEAPRLPQKLAEKRFWAENIKYFKPVLEKTLEENKSLLKELNYSTEKEEYVKKFEVIEKIIIDDFEAAQVAVIPQKDKVDQFLETSRKILLPVFDRFKKLANSVAFSEDEKPKVYNIQGLVNITDKGDFTENGVAHLNFDSFLAESVRNNYCDGFFQIFNSVATKKYVFDQENIFKAIDKLNLDANTHIIITFGFINIQYYLENLKIPGLTNESYNDIPLLSFPGKIYGVSNSLFILAKSDLPRIEYKDFDAKTIELYEMKQILEDYHVYAGVSDLHTNNTLRIQIDKEESEKDKDLNKSVWQGIMFITLIKWAKELNMVQILIRNDFENQRKLSNLDEVTSLE